jgi:hypothetical protein
MDSTNMAKTLTAVKSGHRMRGPPDAQRLHDLAPIVVELARKPFDYSPVKRDWRIKAAVAALQWWPASLAA